MTNEDDACQLGHQDAGVGDLLDELKALARVTTDAGLASAIGVKPSAVAQWRRRKSVPQAVVLRLKGALYEMRRDVECSYYLGRIPEELSILSRALGLSYILDRYPALQSPGSPRKAYALRDAATELGEASVAASLLIRRDMASSRNGPWDAFKALVSSSEIAEALQELIYGGAVQEALTATPRPLPQ